MSPSALTNAPVQIAELDLLPIMYKKQTFCQTHKKTA
jgi:hypothetical protein